LITITHAAESNTNMLEQIIILPAGKLQEVVTQNTAAAASATNYSALLPSVIYFFVTVFLLTRFIKNIFSIGYKIKTNARAPYHNSILVLTNDKLIPHSFLHYIFIDREAYEQHLLEKEILQHELTHVQQKHSYDIIAIELLLAISWFNPFLFLYRKAIQLNHEFLADETVVKTFNNTTAYQSLLLEKSVPSQTLSLTSQFNYLITKKRLLMMTKQSSKKTLVAKQLAVLPLLAAAFLLFSSTAYTQSATGKAPAVASKAVAYGDGATQAMLNEYDSVIKSMRSIRTLKDGKKIDVMDMGKCNVERMAFIFYAMNKEQRDLRLIATHMSFEPYTPPVKNAPGAAQLSAWTNAKKYGVWLDGKRIANAELNKYKASDFAHYWESKLSKNAINYGKHYYQIDLYTEDYFYKAYVQDHPKDRVRPFWIGSKPVE
jgi:hypothetical protein